MIRYSSGDLWCEVHRRARTSWNAPFLHLGSTAEIADEATSTRSVERNIPGLDIAVHELLIVVKVGERVVDGQLITVLEGGMDAASLAVVGGELDDLQRRVDIGIPLRLEHRDEPRVVEVLQQAGLAFRNTTRNAEQAISCPTVVLPPAVGPETTMRSPVGRSLITGSDTARVFRRRARAAQPIPRTHR